MVKLHSGNRGQARVRPAGIGLETGSGTARPPTGGRQATAEAPGARRDNQRQHTDTTNQEREK